MTVIKLDMIGEVCPVPLLRVQKMSTYLKRGDTIQIDVDYNRAVCNILDWADQQGLKHDILEIAHGWRVIIRNAGKN